MADEIASHVAMLTEENLRAGMMPAQAERSARLTFGGVEAVKESYRDERGLPWLESLFTDVRYAVRGLRKSAGFTLTAVAALAVGIGSTTAIFSIVNALLLKPLPFPDPDRLMMLTIADGTDRRIPVSSPAMFAHSRAQTGVLWDISAVVPDDTVMNYTGGEVVEQWRSMRVSADFFDCTGFRFLHGRAFSAKEDSPNGPRVVAIDQGLWARRFASDPAIIGRTVSLNEIAHTVVGIVAPSPAFREFGMTPEVYVPMRLDPNSGDLGGYFMSVARLKPGVTLEQTRLYLRASTANYRAKFPGSLEPNQSFSVTPLREFVTGELRPMLLVLLGAVGLVLLIACANVANLLLARAAVRRREIGIRAAIGAGRGRIVRQLLTESVLLAVMGGGSGLLLGYGGIRMLLATNTADFPLVGDKGETVLLDWRVAGFVLAVSLFTAVLFGLFPALRGSRVDLNAFLKDGGKGSGLRQSRARAALVVSEVSLAVILLVGSALLIRSFVALYRVDRGFETKNVMTMQTLLGGPKYATSAGVADTIRLGLERIRAIPGVAAASAGAQVPLQGTSDLPFDVVGQVDPPGAAGWAAISPGYFEVFNIAVKRGREFNDRDTGSSAPVVVINETMAKQFWKDRDPLNGRIKIGRDVMKDLKDEPVRQIIGIVADVRDTGLQNVPRPVMYVPQAQVPDTFTAAFFRDDFTNWIVRTRTDPHKLAPEIQKQLREATGLPVSNLLMMDQVVSRSIARQRFSLLLMAVFGGAALLLAAMGIYGLMAYTVEQRTHEIGIRLALGADAKQVRRMVVRQGMGLAMMGAAIGIAASWALARTLESLLFGVKARDPLVFIAVPLVLGAVALWAVWLPALRSSRVDPLVALRYE
jgi:putative ABC transport system permease protein